jgi:hypothetical protein
MSECARVGCTFPAKGDEFCSRECCIRQNDVRDMDAENRERRNRQARVRRLKKKHGSGVVVVDNHDASAHIADGRLVFGKRHMHSTETDR